MSNAPADSGTSAASRVPSPLISRNPLEWLRVFGPGAVIASLTIGTGELIFSARGGVIFGYSILLPILLICVLKWTLAYSAARHMVIAGAHPFERWMDLPFGPRGWLTVLFFLLAIVCIPVWISFHASVLGDLLAGLTGTKQHVGRATIYLWGAGMLVGIYLLAVAGGYSALEKIQLAIVVAMLAAVVTTLILYGPDWLELVSGFVVPQRLEFPAWFKDDARHAVRQIADRPVWVELSLYAGVIGGAGYDYLAYTSYIRDKGWGNAALEPRLDNSVVRRSLDLAAVDVAPSGDQPQSTPQDDQTIRQWIRAPLIDCTLSFLIVLLFSAVFVASGKLVLGPVRQIPSSETYLDHQAQFVTQIHPWLYPLYVTAVFLAIAGTCYGTLEVAPVVLRESAVALRTGWLTRAGPQRMRLLAISWCVGVALVVLAVYFVYQLEAGEKKPLDSMALLMPVNLFTGVFACGVICLLNPWNDLRLPAQFRMPLALAALNVIGGIGFIVAALRGYWDYAGWWAFGILLGILAFGVLIAWLANLWQKPG
jgi:hypothetical protein